MQGMAGFGLDYFAGADLIFVKRVAAGHAIETDAAGSARWGKARSVAYATETDAANAAGYSILAPVIGSFRLAGLPRF